MSATPQQNPSGAYELGRMAEALSQNNRTLAKLTEAVEENSRSTSQLAHRQSKLEDSIKTLQADQQKMIPLAMTGYTSDAEVRRRFEYLDRIYQKDQDTHGIVTHGKKALAGAVVVAVMWWGWSMIKDAAVSEVAAQVGRIAEMRGKTK